MGEYQSKWGTGLDIYLKVSFFCKTENAREVGNPVSAKSDILITCGIPFTSLKNFNLFFLVLPHFLLLFKSYFKCFSFIHPSIYPSIQPSHFFEAMSFETDYCPKLEYWCHHLKRYLFLCQCWTLEFLTYQLDCIFYNRDRVTHIYNLYNIFF